MVFSRLDFKQFSKLHFKLRISSARSVSISHVALTQRAIEINFKSRLKSVSNLYSNANTVAMQ